MTPCLSADSLGRYENGEFSDRDADTLERHLKTCAACQAIMADIRSSDAGAKKLRGLFQDALRTRISTSPGDSFSIGVLASPPVNQGNERPVNSDESTWPIPDYERVLLCGEGSYGSVWAVRDRVGVYRALKIIDLERVGRARAALRERNALESYCRKITRHPYLVTIHHVGVINNLLYYTMELADDRNTPGMIRDRFPDGYHPLTLDTIMKGRRLNVDVAMEIARRLLRGLSKLHSMDLVHRDIKPSNVILVNRQPKLADIGLVSAEGELAPSIGTPRYMPPDRKTDKTGDIFAFGKVLHEMIAGPDDECFPKFNPRKPWGSTKWDQGRVEELLARACASTAAARFPSATVMLEELEACAELTFDRLYDVLPEAENLAPTAGHGIWHQGRRSETVQVALACIRTIPWILAFIAAMAAISKLLA